MEWLLADPTGKIRPVDNSTYIHPCEEKMVNGIRSFVEGKDLNL
jgi:hypothetical protein